MLVFLLLGACSGRKKQPDFTWNDWKEGDVVFRKGTSTKSRAVLQADTSGIYSHVGIVVKTDSAWMIVHVTPGERAEGENVDRTKLEYISAFFSPDRAEQGAVGRLIQADSVAFSAAQYAVLFYQSGILFDHDYNLEDSLEMYCSELVWRAYLLAGVDITQGKRNVITNFPLFSGTYIFPSDIYRNKSLEIVYKY